ncbi:D-amino acid dehydrogenase [Bradyrhizobium sp. U87765 SZCCT0131]|uniref:D-amino acid dehydrogenase n=1 Tax=unclassified Bradyrhizobium TaxID=2631580 RepID=UPI001BA88B1D|nr:MULTISPECIES: D-amino acid dehydrogenase [unclassified Bradyrhizobium]MBR1218806.1 D-amino acid dehydrogenase [Bradyrhizobium sp. U87765 SZCCT0131]MBR1261457.1 D-amino acid dehydrogenase [Bradyrhizobium sp. U87765 SZCCT0134]MBR1306690.1 D-amino acid dehydrogenase [Bradyrhizobium sp. U87765 SZCCT0110]MBR1317239.1 D-amino acid dehydrogenase [Bradyrhizobium sp. U87765 SZCCT0109]MBR1350941.1 D-amino acid dehydrogenase [Bradyrhizobium sp. U87765 SZCCT0048]
MKVAVLGGGVIGVTTAYYLARAGHEVTVIDRQDGVALETSFANAGQVSPGYASPWAAPGIPAKAMKWLFMEHAPLILRPRLDVAMVRWLFSMLRNCTSARYALNKGRMVRLAEYSRDCLIALRKDTGIAYDGRAQGTLQLFRTKAQLDGTAKDIEVLRADGVPFELLDPAGCVAAEPALAHARDKITGGLRLPNDETGDCFKFTNALAKLAAAAGVAFRYGCAIEGLRTERGAITGVQTSAGLVTADAYVLALGSFAPRIAAMIGLRLPIYPVKGYSLTIPIVDASRAPESTIMDETYKIAITRLGDRIRVGGMAEISGYTNDLPPRRRATLEHSVTDLFAGGGDVAAATFWSGLRPMTPDGTPVIGGTRYPNLFLNGGHGTLGWTMACGSARVLTDIIGGRAPEIDASDLGLDRYGA